MFWDVCPYRLRVIFIGKEKRPTVGFNCTVDHDCKFLYGEWFVGRINDKTKVWYDKCVEKFRTGEFKDVTFNYVDQNGVVQQETGSYVICDNDYHRWTQTLVPCSTTVIPHLTMSSKKEESTSKDVEWAFDMSKKRFRILKFPFTLHDVHDIKFVVITFFTFHNMPFDHNEQFRDQTRDEFSDSRQLCKWTEQTV